MTVVSLDSKNFGPVLARPGILLIHWWGRWCVPCRDFDPIFERVAERHPDITFARVDVDTQEELVEVLGVQAMPALMVFRDGFLLLNHVGVLLEPLLEDLVWQARGLDMNEERRKLSELRASKTRVRVGLHPHGP
ncbi:MAG TPA: thioredoxin family protein [Archangium sp.]|jgi:thioredoxin 1|uniref:thioredoxin family protein n=1 Tax=Archangium sp. TaxID=1872627 RepID=UPI002ED8353D